MKKRFSEEQIIGVLHQPERAAEQSAGQLGSEAANKSMTRETPSIASLTYR